MSLQNLFSFDKITTADILALPRVVGMNGSISIGANSGRDGTGALVVNGVGYLGGIDFAIDPFADVTLGAWIVTESSPGSNNGTNGIWFSFGNAEIDPTNNAHNAHVGIGPRADGSIAAYLGASGTVIGATAPGVITFGTNAPYHVEMRVIIGATGSITIKVNGTQVLNVTGVDTQMGTSSTISFIHLAAPNAVVTRYDDMYISTAEVTGDGVTGFMGMLKINAKLVNAIGDLNQWTPSVPTGVNWQNVDEPTPNQSDYNTAATVGLIDTYNIEDVSFNPVAIELDLYVKKLDAGASSGAHVLRHASANYVSATPFTLSPAPKYYKKTYTLDPLNNAWTSAVFNALQVGIQKAL